MSQVLFALVDSRQRIPLGFHGKQLVVFLIIGTAVMLLFGFLYFQEWLVNRKIRRMTEMAREKQAHAQALAKPPAPRLPLIRSKPLHRTNGQKLPQPNDTPRLLAEEHAPAAASESADPQDKSDESAVKSNRGRLEVCAEDAVCEVYVDRAFIGNTPARLTLPEGSHLVEVKHPEGQTYRRKIYVSEGADLRLQAFLESEQSGVQRAEQHA